MLNYWERLRRDTRARRPLAKMVCVAAAAAVAIALGGCAASPFHTEDHAQSYARFADSLLARTVASSLPQAPRGAGADQGVHEFDSTAAAHHPYHESMDSQVVVPAPYRKITRRHPRLKEPRNIKAKAYIGEHVAALNQPEHRIYLSLQSAIERAMRHSLAIKVQAYNPGIRAAEVTQAQAAFDAVLFANTQYNHTDEPSPYTPFNTSTTSPVLPGTNRQDTVASQIGVRKLLSTGATVQLGVGENYLDVKQNPQGFFPTINPSNTADINLTIDQPLLQGFGGLTSKATIYLAQRNQRIALAQFRSNVIGQVSKVEQGYYQLVGSYSALKIQQRLLEDTEVTQKRLVARGQFDVNSVQIAQGRSAVEQRKADLIKAQGNLRSASDQLKDLINDPSLSLRGNDLLIPTDKPIDVPVAFNVADALETALRQRSILQEDRQNIQRADIEIGVAKNDLLPKANLTFSTQTTGLAADGSFNGAFNRTVNGLHFMDYAAGIQVSIPLGNRAAEGQLEQRKLERAQSVTQMLADAHTVIYQVKTELRNLLTSYQQTQAYDAERRAAADELTGLEIQQGAGQKLTPTFLQLKLDAQQALANAELSEVQSLINYNDALVLLQQAQGTLLEFDRIAIAPAPLGEPRYEGRIRFLGHSYPSHIKSK